MKVRVIKPWVYSATVDGLFILLPPFLALGVVAGFAMTGVNLNQVDTISWLMLVVFIDVAHVYSTLFRTYFDKEAFTKQKSLLINIPLFAFIGGVICYSISPLWFWRLLAYMAVYHFVRQQYGFIRIYSRSDKVPGWHRSLDTFTIYGCTLYPILHWHLKGPHNFSWFVEGDFFYLHLPELATWLGYLYVLLLLLYITKEVNAAVRQKVFNWPRNLMLAGTALSWYFGIIYFDADLAFTMLNVVAHGIPYMALIWIYGKKKQEGKGYTGWLDHIFRRYGVILFVLIISAFAFIEEGLWDVWIWNDHSQLFTLFHFMEGWFGNSNFNFLVPLLVLPQTTHYILDGFIWRIGKGEMNWVARTNV